LRGADFEMTASILIRAAPICFGGRAFRLAGTTFDFFRRPFDSRPSYLKCMAWYLIS